MRDDGQVSGVMFNSFEVSSTRAHVATNCVGLEFLIGLLLLLSSFIPVQGAFSESCPGMRRMHVNDNPTCCFPILCPKDYQYRLCNTTVGSSGYDSCEKCPVDYINPVHVNTRLSNYSEYEYEMCYVPSCDCHPGAILINKQQCMKNGVRKKCKCDLENGYWGDPDHCNLVDKAKVRVQGKELTQSGQILPCKKGFFKSKGDDSLCIPHTKCTPNEILESHGTTVSDNKCVLVSPQLKPTASKIGNITRKNPTGNVTRNSPTGNVTRNFPIGNVTNKSPGNDKDYLNSDNTTALYIGIFSVVGTIFLCIVAFLGKACHSWKNDYIGKISFISYIRLVVKQRTFAIVLYDEVTNRRRDPFEPQNNNEVPSNAVDSDENHQLSTDIPEGTPLLENLSDPSETGNEAGNSTDGQQGHKPQLHIETEVAKGDNTVRQNIPVKPGSQMGRGHGANNWSQEHDTKPTAKVAPQRFEGHSCQHESPDIFSVTPQRREVEPVQVNSEQETGEPSTYVPYVSSRFLDISPMNLEMQEESGEEESSTSDATQEKMVSSSSD